MSTILVVTVVELLVLFAIQSMNYNNILLNLFILDYIIVLYYILLYYIILYYITSYISFATYLQFG